MRTLLIFLSLFSSLIGYSHVHESFAITTNGDTIFMYKNVYIDVHSHPQVVFYRDELNARKKISSDTLIQLTIYDVSFFKNEVKDVSYAVKKIVFKDGLCSHFVGEIYRLDDFVVYESPFCAQDDKLILYIKNEEGNLISINKNNYHHLIDAHFADWEGIDKIRRKRYNPYKLRDYLIEHYLVLLQKG